MKYSKTCLSAALILCVAGGGIALALGMRVQPGGALIQNFPLGEKRALPTPFVIYNDNDTPTTMTVVAVKPSEVGSTAPRGYSEIPDPKWMSFEPSEITIPAKQRGTMKMFLTVPQDEKYLNQHWSVSLAVRTVVGKHERIGLAVYPRFEIETQPGARAQPPEGQLVITPSQALFEELVTGAPALQKTFRIWNSTDKRLQCKVAAWGRPEKDSRPAAALSHGQSWIPDTTWVRIKDNTVAIPPQVHVDIPIEIAVPQDDAYRGGTWETILMVTAKDDLVTFARLRLKTRKE